MPVTNPVGVYGKADGRRLTQRPRAEWGLQDPLRSVRHADVQFYGYDESDVYRVRHLRFVRPGRNPQTGRFQRWYEPVVGEPNATVIYSD